MARLCEVEGCDRISYAANVLCYPHRWRLRVHGDVRAEIPIGRMHNGVPVKTAPKPDPEEALRVAYEPTPAEGHGLLWLV